MWPSNLFYLGLTLGIIIGAGGIIIWAIFGAKPPESDWQDYKPGPLRTPQPKWPNLSTTAAEKDPP